MNASHNSPALSTRHRRSLYDFLTYLPRKIVGLCSYFIDLIIELCGANLEASAKNDKNALSTLQFLATFALTQGGALALASQFTKNTGWLLFVYLVLAVFTIAGVIYLLRLTEYVADVPADTYPRHYFDYSTIRFARWTLGCTILLPILFVMLVAFGFSPLVRATMSSNTILGFDKPVSAAKVKGLSFAGRSLTSEARSQDLLLKWLSNGAATDGNTLFVLRQTEPFPTSYYDFAVEADFGKANAGQPANEDLLAFLVRDDLRGAGIESDIRPLHFRKDVAGNFTRILDVRSPGKNDRIVLLMVRKDAAALEEFHLIVR